MIGAYLRDLRHGHNINSMPSLRSKTLSNYLQSAATALSLFRTDEKPFSIYTSATANTANPSLHPFLAEQLRQRSTWSQPSEKKEPYTYDMFLVLHSRRTSTFADSISKEAAVYDWARLGCFTGSRLSEYGQSKVPKGQRYATVPRSPDTGIWGGSPIAFIRSDFTYYDVHGLLLSAAVLYATFRAKAIAEVHIRFRFDKSADNFSVRKFSNTNHHILNPVAATISILIRADHLRIPASEPIGGFVGTKYPYLFLSDRHITSVMRLACTLAYPHQAGEISRILYKFQSN